MGTDGNAAVGSGVKVIVLPCLGCDEGTVTPRRPWHAWLSARLRGGLAWRATRPWCGVTTQIYATDALRRRLLRTRARADA